MNVVYNVQMMITTCGTHLEVSRGTYTSGLMTGNQSLEVRDLLNSGGEITLRLWADYEVQKKHTLKRYGIKLWIKVEGS